MSKEFVFSQVEFIIEDTLYSKALYLENKITPGSRDDFREITKPYIDRITSLILDSISEDLLIQECDSLITNIEYEHSVENLKIAIQRFNKIDKKGRLCEMDLDYYLKKQKRLILSPIEKCNFSGKYYFYDEMNIENDCGTQSLESQYLFKKKDFYIYWQKLIESGLSWINFVAVGYWKDGIVICLEHRDHYFHIPRGLTPVNFSSYLNEESCLFSDIVKVI